MSSVEGDAHEDLMRHRWKKSGRLRVAAAGAGLAVVAGLGLAALRSVGERDAPGTSAEPASAADVGLSCEPAQGTLNYSPGVSDVATEQVVTGSLTLRCIDQQGALLSGQVAIEGTLSVALYTLADAQAGADLGSLGATINWSDSSRSELAIVIQATGTGSPTQAQLQLEVTNGAFVGAHAFSIITVGPATVPIVSQSLTMTAFSLCDELTNLSCPSSERAPPEESAK